MACVPQQETVCCVAQPNITLWTVPGCVHAAFLDVVTARTSASLVFGSLVGVIHGNGGGKVAKGEIAPHLHHNQALVRCNSCRWAPWLTANETQGWFCGVGFYRSASVGWRHLLWLHQKGSKKYIYKTSCTLSYSGSNLATDHPCRLLP